MSEKDEKKAGGWFKALLGTIAGLLSGAVFMYVSPLLDKVIKPAKPVANFAVDPSSVTVTFHNRSIGGTEGWWDFGDGSPLEPLTAGQDTIVHTYPGPGDYSAKLSLRNLLGEESERSVTVRIDGAKASTPPEIEKFEAEPISQGAFAPATFRINCKVKNAQLTVWDLGDDRPLEFAADATERQDRLVTFKKPGGYVIKMAAVNGNQAKERSEVVYVNDPPVNTVTAVLSVTDVATRVETQTSQFTFEGLFPPGQKDATCLVDRSAPARVGYEIVDIRLPGPPNAPPQPVKKLPGGFVLGVDPAVTGPGVKDVRLTLAQDRKSVRLTCELARDAGPKRGVPPRLLLPIVLVQERRTSAARPPVPVTCTVPVGGSAILTLPPLPEGWTDARRQVRLALLEGDRTVYPESVLPRNTAVVVQGRRCQLTAMQTGEQVRVDLSPAQSVGGVRPLTN